MFDYLVAPAASNLPAYADVAVVFGRCSQALEETAVAVAKRSGAMIVSGYVGKDSGSNAAAGIPEYRPIVERVVDSSYLVSSQVFVDRNRPLNGRDNAVNSIELIRNPGRGLGMLCVPNIVTVHHATQTRRLGATFAYQAERAGLRMDDLAHVASNYPFDPANPFDQYEVVFEISRIADLSQGPNQVLERPDDFDTVDLEYAALVKAHLEQEFRDRGIRNPSTADGTNRARSVAAMMVLFAERGSLPLVEIPRNLIRLWPLVRAELQARTAARK
jgi:hypothetical protein